MDFWVPYQTIPFLRHQFWNLKQVDASPDLANVEPPQHDLKEDKCISWDERISTSLETTWDFSTAGHSLKIGRVLMFWGGDLQHSEFFRENWIFSVLASDFTGTSRIYQLEEQNTEYRADLYDLSPYILRWPKDCNFFMIFGSPSIRFAETSELYHECFIAPRFAICGLGPRSVGAGGGFGRLSNMPPSASKRTWHNGTTVGFFEVEHGKIYIYI